MGSSDLSTTRKAILLLTLSLENPNGEVVNKTYEMDLDSLNDLLKKFDRVANATQKLRIARRDPRFPKGSQIVISSPF